MCKNYNVCILPVVIAVILGVVIGALFFAGTIAAGVIGVPKPKNVYVNMEDA